MNIPEEIVKYAVEAKSGHNDGFVKKYFKERLIEIRDYINRILDGDGKWHQQ